MHQPILDRFLFISDNLRKSERYVCWIKKITHNGKLESIVTLILIIFIILQVLFVVNGAFSHPTDFSFDEEYTIRVARQQPADIVEIVSYEQNFPAYHLLLHWLIYLPFNDMRTVHLFQLIIWVAGVIVFWFTLHLLGASLIQHLLFILLYVCTYGISKYASYVRMYGLLVLLFLLVVYFFVRYIKSEKIINIGMSGLWLILLAPLHPVALPIIAIFFYTGLWTIKDKITRMTYSMFLAAAGFVGVINLLLKRRGLAEIYITDGVRYLNELRNYRRIYSYPHLVFFGDSSPGEWLFLLIVIYLLYRFVHYQQNKPINLLLGIFGAVFVGTLFLSRWINIGHHVVFLVPMLILIFLRSYQTLVERRRRILGLALLSYFLFTNMYQYTKQVNYDRWFMQLCYEFSTISPGNIISNHVNISALIHCFPSQKFNFYMETIDGSFKKFDNPLASKELLIELAKIGGSFGVGGHRLGYRNYLAQNTAELHKKLVELEKFYYVTPGSPSLYYEELQFFTKHHYYSENLLRYVHVFKRKPVPHYYE